MLKRVGESTKPCRTPGNTGLMEWERVWLESIVPVCLEDAGDLFWVCDAIPVH